MQKTTIFIEYPATAAGRREWAREYGLNAYYTGKHWAQRKRDADYWHILTRHACYDAGIKRNGQRLYKKRVCIKFWWNDRLDIDNHAVMAKMIVDGLKGIVIEDDDKKHVGSVQHFWHDNDFIKIEITEMRDKKQHKDKRAG